MTLGKGDSGCKRSFWIARVLPLSVSLSLSFLPIPVLFTFSFQVFCDILSLKVSILGMVQIEQVNSALFNMEETASE